MTQEPKKQVEQVSLEFIVENAQEAFAKTVLSTRTKVLLIGGFTDESTAIKAYMARTRPDIDRRKKLNDTDTTYVKTVEMYAESANEYVKWVRADDGQPVWREALVSYCTAFENCLKAIAMAFLLADRNPDASLSQQVLIPSKDLTWARRDISKQWYEAAEGDLPKVRNFFESAIRSKRCAHHYDGHTDSVTGEDWEICSAAFQVRNAIVHNLGVMPYSVGLGKLELHAGWPVELNQSAVASVANSLSKIVSPFDFQPLGL